MEWNTMYDWKIIFDNKYEDHFTLMSNEQYVTVICLKTQFSDFTPIVFELTESSAKLMSQPHFVESVTIGLDKIITIEFNEFFGFQDLEENNIEE